MNHIRTSIAEISFDCSNNILHVKILEGAHMDLKNAKEHYKKINDLIGNNKYFALVDASNYFTMEKEAWQYASREEVVSNRIAIAHYNSSLPNSLITNFFKKAYKTTMPLEIFSTQAKALKWLNSHEAGPLNK